MNSLNTELSRDERKLDPKRADRRGDDAIRLEVLRHELTSVAEEMGITMQRTARSFTAREGGDYSTALIGPTGGLIAQGFANGIHLGSLVEIMIPLLDKFDGSLYEGDILISNDPYGGLSHLPDIAMVMPVFVAGELAGFSAIDLHHSDIGGRHAGGMGVASRQIFEEGIRLPGVKLYDRGLPNQALLDTIAACVRTPESVLGDLAAQAASCRRGDVGLRALIARYGLVEFRRLAEVLNSISEDQMRRFIASLPDGAYRYSEEFEQGGNASDNAVLVAVEVRIDGDRATVEFSGSSAQVDSAINVPFGLTKSATFIVFRALAGGEIFPNSGLIEPIMVEAELGSVLRPAFPAAVGARGMLMWRLIDVIMRALADASPGKVPAAGDGGANGMVFSGSSGKLLVDWYCSGWGARPGSDGVDGVSNIILGGMMHSLPGELMEQEFPVVLESFALEPDTEGAGEYRGALSMSRSWRFLEKGTVLLRSCRADSRPYGLAGGASGSPNVAYVIRTSGEREILKGISVECAVEPGDVIVHIQPGGGGLGDPSKRDAERIARDLRDGKLTVGRAASVYGWESAE